MRALSRLQMSETSRAITPILDTESDAINDSRVAILCPTEGGFVEWLKTNSEFPVDLIEASFKLRSSLKNAMYERHFTEYLDDLEYNFYAEKDQDAIR